MGTTIVERNTEQGAKKINIKGILLGDPILDPKAQLPTYANTLYGMGLIMDYERDEIEEIMNKAAKKYDEGKWTEAFNYWNSVWNDNGGGGAPGLF